MPIADGVVLSTARLNRIVRIDAYARTAVVQPGVRNLAISEAAAPHGLYYAPDPSSQIACTIGGNVAENSGGVHCLKYGLTVHNVLRVRVVTIDGEVLELGGECAGLAGPRPAGRLHRLRRHAGHRHRSDGQADTEAGHGACHHGVVRRRRHGRQCGGQRDRRRHHPGRAGNDGPDVVAHGRTVRQGRLRHRRGRHFAVRGRRHARGSGRGNRPHDGRAGRGGRQRHRRLADGSGAHEILVRPQERLSRRRAHLARLLLHGRHHPAQEPGASADGHRRAWKRRMACAAPTCSTPATAICIR